MRGSGPVEPSAAERERAAAREAAAARAKAWRDEQFYGARSSTGTKLKVRRNIKGPLNRVAQVLVVAVALGAAGWWVAGKPGYRHAPKRAAPAAPAGPAGVAVIGTGRTLETTTTLLGLDNFVYGIGACVTWDQKPAAETETHQVPCGQTHLVQVVSAPFQITGFGSTFPGATPLTAYYQKQCTGPAEKFLGYHLDPAGRFDADAVGPTAPANWAAGERTAWCTLQLHSNSWILVPFAGDVRGANQEQLFAIASCGSVSAGLVPCTSLHTWQVTGNVNLSGVATYPRTDQAMQSLVGGHCDAMGLSFVGGTYPSGVQSGWLDLGATSWADGERTVQCIVSKYGPNGITAVSIKGSLAKKSR